MSALSAPNGTDCTSFEDRYSSWTCVHSCLTCVHVRKECSVGKTLVTQIHSKIAIWSHTDFLLWFCAFPDSKWNPASHPVSNGGRSRGCENAFFFFAFSFSSSLCWAKLFISVSKHCTAAPSGMVYGKVQTHLINTQFISIFKHDKT